MFAAKLLLILLLKLLLLVATLTLRCTLLCQIQRGRRGGRYLSIATHGVAALANVKHDAVLGFLVDHLAVVADEVQEQVAVDLDA